tara:strand:+ start:48 stop:665 length:618 start_codon:yes stop_codon:yes gene_type:complete
MALEDLTGTKYLDDLNSSNPAAGDNVSEGDDHIRGIKNVLKTTFPNIDAAVNATPTELNYVDGVTSAIQTQLDAKVSNATHTGDVTGSGALTIAAGAVDIAMMSATGTASSSTFLRGDNAWTAVDALPSQSGHAGKYLTTDASSASWATLDTDANTTTKGLYEHEHTIDANYSITSGSNAMSAGPITISSGISVTVPTGSTWVIV